MSVPIRMSFVVPAYNEEALLPSCLAAIRAEIERTGIEAEVIVVNNASTDRTADIAAATPGVRLVHEPTKGLVQARKAGFEASSGELVANIDADTLLPPGWLARVLAEFARDPELVTVSGPYDYYDVPFRIRAAARVFYLVGFGTYSFNRYVLRVGSMVQGGNFVLKRDALIRAGGFDPTFTFYGEDTDIARRMNRVGRVKFTWALMAKSSGRRLRGDGLIMTGVRYSANYLWATYFRKPFTTAWNDYR
jgi:glycosyltransferase involved in cell wall biosynthesis